MRFLIFLAIFAGVLAAASESNNETMGNATSLGDIANETLGNLTNATEGGGAATNATEGGSNSTDAGGGNSTDAGGAATNTTEDAGESMTNETEAGGSATNETEAGGSADEEGSEEGGNTTSPDEGEGTESNETTPEDAGGEGSSNETGTDSSEGGGAEANATSPEDGGGNNETTAGDDGSVGGRNGTDTFGNDSAIEGAPPKREHEGGGEHIEGDYTDESGGNYGPGEAQPKPHGRAATNDTDDMSFDDELSRFDEMNRTLADKVKELTDLESRAANSTAGGDVFKKTLEKAKDALKGLVGNLKGVCAKLPDSVRPKDCQEIDKKLDRFLNDTETGGALTARGSLGVAYAAGMLGAVALLAL